MRIGVVCLSAAVLMAGMPAHGHDIYTGVRGKDKQLCCGESDCSATTYRERGSDYEFLTREKHWIRAPQDRITFLPIPGDAPSNDSHKAHICYREPMPYDKVEELLSGDGQTIHAYCLFIPPGAT